MASRWCAPREGAGGVTASGLPPRDGRGGVKGSGRGVRRWHDLPRRDQPALPRGDQPPCPVRPTVAIPSRRQGSPGSSARRWPMPVLRMSYKPCIRPGRQMPRAAICISGRAMTCRLITMLRLLSSQGPSSVCGKGGIGSVRSWGRARCRLACERCWPTPKAGRNRPGFTIRAKETRACCRLSKPDIPRCPLGQILFRHRSDAGRRASRSGSGHTATASVLLFSDGAT